MAMAWYGCTWPYMAIWPWHDMDVYGPMALWLSDYMAMEWYCIICLYGYYVCMAMALSGCLWLYGYMAIWLYGYMATAGYGCIVLYSYMAMLYVTVYSMVYSMLYGMVYVCLHLRVQAAMACRLLPELWHGMACSMAW